MQSSPDRATVRRGGLVGLGLGTALLALALFFLVRGPDQPSEVLGVFLPLTAALICLGLAAMALVPLRYGDDASRSPALIARLFRLLGGLGIVVTAAGMLRGELPWLAFGMLPLLAAVALLNDSFRVARQAATTERS
jgi:hypothetical protein